MYNLKDAFPKLFGNKKLIELPNRDYRFRYIVSPEEWAEISVKLTAEAGHYRNFKGECGRQVDKGHLDAKYESLLHRVWHEHMDYQRELQNPLKAKSKGRGAMGYRSSAPESDLWRSHQSQVYDADYQDEDYVLDNRDASEILDDLDEFPSRANTMSLFVDTDIGKVYEADTKRQINKKKKNGWNK